MTYKINDTTVIQDNGDAKFTQLTVTGGSISLPDSNPTRNTTGFKISSLTNIDTSGRGVHSKVTIDVTSPTNYAIVGATKSYGYSAGGASTITFRAFLAPPALSNPGPGAFYTFFQDHYGPSNRYPLNNVRATGVLNANFSIENSVATTAGIVSRFPFSNESINSSVNSLSSPVAFSAGCSSETTGYTLSGITAVDAPGTLPSSSGGGDTSYNTYALQGFSFRGSTTSNVFQKFNFSSDGISKHIIASPLIGKHGMFGYQSTTRGYSFGGISSINPLFEPTSTLRTSSSEMVRFPFATEVLALTGINAPSGSTYGSNVNSSENGYIIGGMSAFRGGFPNFSGQPSLNVGYFTLNNITRFPFATEAYSVRNSNIPLGDARAYQHTHQSSTHGFMSGGHSYCDSAGNQSPIGSPDEPAFSSSRRRKIAFASDTSVATVANLSESLYTRFATQSSDTTGYIDVRRTSPTSVQTGKTHRNATVVQRMKFSFATDLDAADNGGYADFGIGGATGFSG
jgi:hypothetical protein